jgi:hypothetical protein
MREQPDWQRHVFIAENCFYCSAQYDKKEQEKKLYPIMKPFPQEINLTGYACSRTDFFKFKTYHLSLI